MQMKRGSMLAETVIVMPILMLLIFGIVQFALVWTAKQMTAYAAFCATRAIMVVRPDDAGKDEFEQSYAAESAAMVALSWIATADYDRESATRVSIPGWGRVVGSGSMSRRLNVEVLATGSDPGSDDDPEKMVDGPFAAVKVVFRYPLLIPGMGVNNILANATQNPSSRLFTEKDKDFYASLNEADGENLVTISGWPYIELTETCVLPMPYSTANFPKNGFEGTDIYGGDS